MSPWLGLGLLFPFIYPLWMKIFKSKTITWGEWGANTGGGVAVFVLLYALGMAGQTVDFEVINGQVTKKAQVTTSCEHSYECNCRTVTSGSGKNKTSTRVCDTCYDHNEDYDWMVWSDVGSVDIDRIDRQGTGMPPRWNSVKIGDSFSDTNMYTNYVKAVPESLFSTFHASNDQFKGMIPNYPQIYDYYKINRVIPVGVSVQGLTAMNQHLSTRLETIGPTKQANIIVVVTKAASSNYKYALEQAWVGGKKNDVIVVIGSPTYPEIKWVDVIAFGKNKGNSLMTVLLKRHVKELGTLTDGIKVIDTIADTVVDKFDREPMKNFEYLKSEIKPPLWVFITALILSILTSIGLSIYFHKNETF
jgi:hypothetical protein